MKNYSFFAVTDEKGVCGIIHQEYGTLKAIFADKKDAEKVLLKNKHLNLKITNIELICTTIGECTK